MAKPILAAILSCSNTRLTDDEKRLFAEANPLGVSLFMRNIENNFQLKALIKEIKEVIGRDNVLIAIDEEGGRVTRLKPVTKHQFASAETLAKADIRYSRMHAELIAHDMKRYGINVNYSPVIDRKNAKQNAVLSGRCFSPDSKKIVAYAKQIADTYIKSGICPCIKHIPGHFATSLDPHLNIISTDWSLDKIKKETEYIKNFAEYPLIMTSHIILKALDDNNPVTMSEICINEFFRGYLGLKGLLISDAIDMHSLKGSITERAENCWNAGIDIICYCSGIYEDMYNICNQKRFMSEKALIKFANIENIIHNTKKDIDISRTLQLYQTEFEGKLEVNYMYDATEVLNQMLQKGRK